jgi:hypothetical protein
MIRLSKVVFIPEVELELTTDDINLLLTCSARHYDGRCKDASGVNGFLTKTYNYHVNTHFSSVYASGVNGFLAIGNIDKNSNLQFKSLQFFTWDQLDTMCKILEAGFYFHDGREKAAIDMRNFLSGVLVYMKTTTPPPHCKE